MNDQKIWSDATKSDLLRKFLHLPQFPPEFESGDGEGMDMQLPNKVYNRLKAHSNHESRRGQKVHEKKEHSTAVSGLGTIYIYFEASCGIYVGHSNMQCMSWSIYVYCGLLSQALRPHSRAFSLNWQPLQVMPLPRCLDISMRN